MDIHKNAPLTPKGREAMVRSVIESGLTKAAAARQFNTTAKTVAKWVERFCAEGVAGLRDRSSRPHSLPGQTPSATCATVEALRRQRYTGKQIAAEVGISPATVSRILQRLGLNKLSALEPAEPVRRYERECPGELIHIFTRPYTPKTNGKAERFIQTALREWAYARAYQTSDQRSAELPHRLHRYNWHRPHGSLKAKAPISRLRLTKDNLLRLHKNAIAKPDPVAASSAVAINGAGPPDMTEES